MRKEPRQQSTWRGMEWEMARRERAGISSTMPWGKLGAEPTRRIVFGFMRRRSLGTETR
jgi:hypothetical protein